jgi:hypothetical protein
MTGQKSKKPENVPSVPTLLALRVMLALGFFDDIQRRGGVK